MTFGEALHAALPKLLVTKDISLAMAEFSKVWKDGDSHEDRKRNTERAMVMMEEVLEKFHDDRGIFRLLEPPEGAVKIDETTSEYEIPFAIDIGLPVPLVGKIDSWAKHRDTGELWAVEYKTTSDVPTTFIRNMEINPQTIGYCLVLKSMVDKPVVGTYVVALQTAIRKTESLFQPILVQDHELQAFVHWAQFYGSMLLECERRQEFPKNLSACTPYPQYGQGGFMCDFSMLCKAEDWTDVKQFYQIRTPSNFKISTPGDNESEPQQAVT